MEKFIYLFIINSFQRFRFLLYFEILGKMLLILISLTLESYHKDFYRNLVSLTRDSF